MDSWGDEYDIYDIYNDNDNNKIYNLTNDWNTNYFNKINIILDNDEFDLYLDFNTFIKKYDIDNNLKEFLIRNIIYFNLKFTIQLDLSCLSMYSICMSNKLINDNHNEYEYYLDKYLDNHTILPYSKKEIELIYLNIIDCNKIELFIYLNNKYPVITLINDIDKQLLNYNDCNSISYNIINHSLMCSNLITEYILKNYKFKVLNLLYNHFKLNLDIHKLHNIHLLTKIVVNELKDTIIPIDLFFKWGCENYLYNKLIENIVFVSDNVYNYDMYIINCIKSLNYKLLDNVFKNRCLVLSSLHFINIFEELIEIFNNKLNHKYYNDIFIIKTWNIVFPYVYKYLDYYTIKHLLMYNGINDNGINNIVTLRKSYLILPQIEQYIDDWNNSD